MGAPTRSPSVKHREVDAITEIDLALTIERQVIGVPADHDIRRRTS
jgi:hypothetical protein